MSITSRRRILATTGAAIVAAPFLRLRPAHAAEYTYKFGSDMPIGHPLVASVEKACRLVQERTGGRLEIRVFPNNQLGSSTDMLSQLRLGGLEFVTMSGLILANAVPLAAINGVAFAFKRMEDVWSAMDGELGAMVRKKIDASGIVVFDRIFDNGYRQVTSSTKPIRAPDDLRGFKIRVPPSPLWVSLFEGLGASPASINFSETYSALQTHMVDGQETPLLTIDTAKLYEVQEYCALTNHMWDGLWMLANRRTFMALPDKLREVVAQTFREAALEERAEVVRQNRNLKDALAQKGLVFNDVDPEAFRERLKSAGFYSKWQQKFGTEAWDTLQKTVGKLA
jgi:tripartite ATP-independent transporter DctP family solute receptor